MQSDHVPGEQAADVTSTDQIAAYMESGRRNLRSLMQHKRYEQPEPEPTSEPRSAVAEPEGTRCTSRHPFTRERCVQTAGEGHSATTHWSPEGEADEPS